MKNQAKPVLLLAEVGGDSQIQPFFQRQSIPVHICGNMRELLKTIRKQGASMVIADYHYQRNFSMQRSNLDSLFSLLGQSRQRPQLVLLALEEDLPHLQEVLHGPAGRLDPLVLTVPLRSEHLALLVERLNTCNI